MQMLVLISAIGLVLVSWFLLFWMFCGLGFATQMVLDKQLTDGTSILDAFWFGWGVTLLILQLWHFVFPVNDIIFILLCVFAFVNVFVLRRRIWDVVRRLRQNLLFVFLVVVVALWLGINALEMPTAYDTGFRDIQMVMWFDTYPIVPGLNNLFASFAFNHSSYLYHALLDVSIWSDRSYYIGTGLLFMVFFVKTIWSAIQLFRLRHDGHSIQWSWIVATLSIPYFLLGTIGTGQITHFLTDTVVDIVGFLSVIYLLDFLQNYRFENRRHEYLIWRLGILIATGFTLKQSFIVFGLAIGILVLIVWFLRGKQLIQMRRVGRVIAPILIFATILGLPYIARGVITSGYIAYPQSFGRFEVDWAEPLDLVENRQEMLATNTRLRNGDPEEVLSSWSWVVPWFNDLVTNVVDFLIPLAITISALLVYLYARLRNRDHSAFTSDSRIGLWLLLPMLLMVFVWFMTAPNIKYISYIFWISALVMVVLAVVRIDILWEWRIYGVFGILSTCMLYFVYLVVATSALMITVGEDNGFHVRPQPPIKVYVTDSGLEINTPDSHIKQCWDIPLPCTAFPRDAIVERVPGDIRHGFGLSDS